MSEINHNTIFEDADYTPEESQMPDKIVNVDNNQPDNSVQSEILVDKSVQHFQSLADKRLVETVQEKQLREQAEAEAKALREELNLIKNPPKPKVERPQPPQKPQNYNPSDAVNDPESDSYRYREEYESYRDNYQAYQDNLITELHELESRKIQEQNQASFAAKAKADAISKLQTEGGMTPEEAIDCFQWATSPNSTNPKAIADFYKWQKTQSVQNPKANVLNQRTDLRNNNPFPPGVGIGSESATTDTPDDVFNKQFNKKTTRSI